MYIDTRAGIPQTSSSRLQNCQVSPRMEETDTNMCIFLLYTRSIGISFSIVSALFLNRCLSCSCFFCVCVLCVCVCACVRACVRVCVFL